MGHTLRLATEHLVFTKRCRAERKKTERSTVLPACRQTGIGAWSWLCGTCLSRMMISLAIYRCSMQYDVDKSSSCLLSKKLERHVVAETPKCSTDLMSLKCAVDLWTKWRSMRAGFSRLKTTTGRPSMDCSSVTAARTRRRTQCAACLERKGCSGTRRVGDLDNP